MNKYPVVYVISLKSKLTDLSPSTGVFYDSDHIFPLVEKVEIHGATPKGFKGRRTQYGWSSPYFFHGDQYAAFDDLPSALETLKPRLYEARQQVKAQLERLDAMIMTVDGMLVAGDVE